MSDAFSIPGIPSERAADLQSELFPGSADAFDQASVKVVVAAPKGEQLADSQHKAAVDSLVKELSALPQMPDGKDQANPAPANPVDAAAAQQKQMIKAVQQSGGDAATAEGRTPRRCPRSPRTAGSARSAGTSTWTPWPT